MVVKKGAIPVKRQKHQPVITSHFNTSPVHDAHVGADAKRDAIAIYKELSSCNVRFRDVVGGGVEELESATAGWFGQGFIVFILYPHVGAKSSEGLLAWKRGSFGALWWRQFAGRGRRERGK